MNQWLVVSFDKWPHFTLEIKTKEKQKTVAEKSPFLWKFLLESFPVGPKTLHIYTPNLRPSSDAIIHSQYPQNTTVPN